MSRTPPQHGTRACYLRGCRRDECCDANYRYMSRLKLDHHRGQTRRTPAAPVAAHVQTLLANGWTQAQIARTAQCSRRAVWQQVCRSVTNVRRDIAARILAIPATAAPPHEPQDVDATGTIRRMRALAAHGHSMVSQAARFGIHRDQATRIARGDLRKVRSTTAQAVARAYEELSNTPGTSNRARLLAARSGWRDPLWWEDMGRIDDPSFDPDAADRALGRDELAALRRDEIKHLAGFGLNPEQIYERLDREIALSTVRAIVRELHTGQRRGRSATAA